jgi:dCMP deaminase
MSATTMSGEKRCNEDKEEEVDCRCSKSQKVISAGDNNIRDMILKESRGFDINSPSNVPKRSNYISWDDYFLAVAYLSAQRSKDPHPVRNSRDGACIVDAMGRIVGIGYDGFPRGCNDDCLPWALSTNHTSSSSSTEADSGGDGSSKSLPWLETRHPYLCHAEINAILNKCSADVVGGRMFVPNFPSNECAKFIIQSGISEIIYVKDDDEDSDSSRASRILFEVAGVKMTKYKPSVPSIRINFGSSSNTDNDVSSNGDAATKKDNVDEDEMEKYLGLLQREGGIDPFQFTVRKRKDYLSWDAYFMGVAFLSAQRSKDPNTQVGACIVDANKCIIGIGYNGFPRGCSDEILPWSRTGSCELHKKYPYVVHAEVNAILNKCSASVRGATIYVALFPCNECCKVIIQSGVREVVYLHDTYHDTDACKASRIMFKMAGVKLRQYTPDRDEIVIDF